MDGISLNSLRQRIGCWLHERWKTELVLNAPSVANQFGLSWLDLCNRSERLVKDTVTGGRYCDWQDSSKLTVTRLFPRVSQRLFHHCNNLFPISFTEQDPTKGTPLLSFVVGVRGLNRAAQFEASISSMLSQLGIPTEVIVVEQGTKSEYAHRIPAGVRHKLLLLKEESLPYNRSWGLNVGVRMARGRYVALMDADMLIPEDFACECVRVLDKGLEAIRPVRFIFYLSREDSAIVQRTRTVDAVEHIECVVHNAPNPIVIQRDAYLRIGGHDESFYGWGGEDNEFIDRMRTLKIGESGFLPIAHLWHETASRDADVGNFLSQKRLLAPKVRIEKLAHTNFGSEAPQHDWCRP
ncbi:galactosyltransferase-related protein [Stieleria varia]|uniref:Glycosyl transferase family 2 n=1 Tax=Stieleria varia TaxID=2528005 RepID=A0A5C6B222_9BACT|nr:galactosyltransferase-related protein [Stieleria varia]TWU05958.1 Glycosyl transferase family 2 [Stieleria varia]